ncbi:hypothetical protein ACSIMU_003710 [Yersinia enterocolitica]|uniref:hypothetical protein n=1 Tax=Yersinia proxima TaxID=2890316 RepID=UPI001D10A4B8|nr:hypothetical protein [Yersinia proxima]
MSVISLAELLDQLKTEEKAFINESEKLVLVTGVSFEDSKHIISLCIKLNLVIVISDSENNNWEHNNIPESFAPFKISITKPSSPSGNILLLTNVGLSNWLKKDGLDDTKEIWEIARLNQNILTFSKAFIPWNGVIDNFSQSPKTKSPRSLVKEYSSKRTIPSDIRPWLLVSDIDENLFNDLTFKVWATKSVNILLSCLADEIDAEDNSLRFKGPPKLSLSSIDKRIDILDVLGHVGLNNLHQTLKWIFENEREAELKHILLATELARSGGGNNDPLICILNYLSSALDGAKIAYQMSLSELGRDTLKTLADLRKAVTEETAKVTDTTKQLVTAIAGALAVGVGLIAARVTGNINGEIINSIMLIILVYISVIIFSGHRFIQIQKQLRVDWQLRLYRFLPPSEYDKMVTIPAEKAGRTYYFSALFSALSVAILAYSIFFGTVTTEKNNPPPPVDITPSLLLEPQIPIPPGKINDMVNGNS